MKRITKSQKQENIKEKLEMLNECIKIQKNEGREAVLGAKIHADQKQDLLKC